MKLKVCGMNYNPTEVATLEPDYLGFIFWEDSPRFFEGPMPQLPPSIQKVGVFVRAEIANILELVDKYNLDAIQLHGGEDVAYCMTLKERISARSKTGVKSMKGGDAVSLIKVFSVRENFDFGRLKPFEAHCDYFLFDTKGALPGGNGFRFDWGVMTEYPSTKPYFLSGGIGPDHVAELREFLALPQANRCHAIDVNSRFETSPGAKDIDRLKAFKKSLWNKNR